MGLSWRRRHTSSGHGRTLVDVMMSVGMRVARKVEKRTPGISFSCRYLGINQPGA
jgi:hypothetical protein